MCELASHNNAAAIQRVPSEGHDGNDPHCYSVIGSSPGEHGLLPFNLHIKVFIELPATFSDALTVYTDRNGAALPAGRLERTTYTCASPPAGLQDRIFSAFRDSIHHHWNNKLWLATHRRTQREIPGLLCGIVLHHVTVPTEAHLVMKALYRYTAPSNAHPDTREFRAFCDRTGGNPERAGQDIVIDYPSSRGGPENGTRADFDLEYRAVNTSNRGRVDFDQNVAAHEFGHYLGLNHRCERPGAADNNVEDAYCANRSRGRQRDIMAIGNTIERWHAQPWFSRLPRHHHYCELRWDKLTLRERAP